MKNNCVIVLNKNGEYWTQYSVARAIRKLLNNRATVVSEDRNRLLGVIKIGWDFDAKFKPVYLPFIIQLSYFDYYHYKSEKVYYSDDAVFVRDKSECQYWHDYTLDTSTGKPIRIPANRHKYLCSNSEITVDHVIPISRGGAKNDFTNSVTACQYCNGIIKKDQTPEEAGLELIRKPKVPHRVKGDIARSFFSFNENIEAHRVYIEYLKRSK